MLIASAELPGKPAPMQGWLDLCVDEHGNLFYLNDPNIGTVPAYQNLYESIGFPEFQRQSIICYLHTDVTIHERGWDRRISREFDDPRVAVVGMGGATGIGTQDLYRKPYEITQLIRHGYASNQTDWQVHGEHEAGVRDVAVLDGFCLAVRRSFLDEIGGWKWFPYTFHCYDIAMCLKAIRHGYKVRMVGVNVTHHGGGGSTTPEYKAWCESRGTTMALEHSKPHRWLYREFADLLPYRTPA